MSLRATGAQEGALRPLLRITPAGDVRGCPRPQTNFIHILWENLFAITSRRLGFALDPGGGGAGDVRPSPVVSVKATLRPGAQLGAHVDRQHAEEDGCNLSSTGDAIGRAMRAPTGWRAESWPRPASLAAARQFTFSRPTKLHGNSPSRALRNCAAMAYGVAANPLPVVMAIGRQPESITYLCARSAP